MRASLKCSGRMGINEWLLPLLAGKSADWLCRVRRFFPVLHAIRSVNRADLLISDVGSVKGVTPMPLCRICWLRAPVHPIAGSEKVVWRRHALVFSATK